ncbi:hypothetical protein FGO68_gene15874 [Halteria grandinella]|uniref:Uncharacterized protein n=1 Tax=Halteria grandinella TaxID=5974 RepID=A0A8J8P2D2_HALGN|nr:hypothetical protein FGO68_gene15874 [Halteria grandinella]
MDSHFQLTSMLDEYVLDKKQTLKNYVDQFQSLQNEIELYYDKNLAESSAKGEILMLQQNNPALIAFKDRFSHFKFLKEFGLPVLWTIYSDAIRHPSFQEALLYQSPSNIEIFLKLRLHRLQQILNTVHDEWDIMADTQFNILEHPM